MRIKLAALMLAVLTLASCACCAKRRMPEPETEFDTISDYASWAENEGYRDGALTDEGFLGLSQDRFATLPGQPGYDSGRIVIGDSRCCQLGMYQLRAHADDFAVFAVWGGHYTDREPRIPTEGFFKAVEECFRAQIASKGRCEIFFFATVNDYDHVGNDNSGNIAAALRCAEALSQMSCERSGRTVRPSMTVIGIEGGTLSRYIPEDFNAFVGSYNEALESAAAQSRGFACVPRFTSVPEITNHSTGFIDDGLHYNDATLKALAEFITE